MTSFLVSFSFFLCSFFSFLFLLVGDTKSPLHLSVCTTFFSVHCSYLFFSFPLFQTSPFSPFPIIIITRGARAAPSESVFLSVRDQPSRAENSLGEPCYTMLCYAFFPFQPLQTPNLSFRFISTLLFSFLLSLFPFGLALPLFFP